MKNKFNYIHIAPLLLALVAYYFVFSSNFLSLEALFLDKFSGRLKLKNEYTIFYIDEQSNEFLGQRYPYSPDTYEKAIDFIVENSPRGLSLLIDQGETLEDRSNPYKDVIRKLNKFVETKGYVLIGERVDAAGVNDSFSRYFNFPKNLAFVTSDDENFSKDGKVRRVVLSLSSSLSFPSALAERVSGNSFNSFKKNGEYYFEEADATFSNFSYISNDLKENIIYVPFHKLLTGNVDPKAIQGKHVLIGNMFVSNQENFHKKANGEKSPHLQFYIEEAESLLQGKNYGHASETMVRFFLTVLTITTFLFVITLRPSTSTLIFFGTAFGLCIISIFLFSFFNIYFPLVKCLLGTSITYFITLPFRAIADNKKAKFLEEESRLLKEVEELKNNFMNLMSHDLKTPIAKISSLVDNMRQGQNDETMMNKLNLVDQSTEELNKFISEILDISKIEAKKFNISKQQRDINKIITKVVDDIRFYSEERGIELRLKLETLFPITIDENLIYRVVFNLVENAVKYGKPGGEVCIQTLDSGDYIEIIVEDDGYGIEEKDLKFIFDKFYRVKNNSNEIIKGSGLGLYLVKYFIEAHGGKIEVASSNKGTVFNVSLLNQ